jgi:predicted sugar kinase
MTDRQPTQHREYDPVKSYKSAADVQREIDLIRWHSIQRIEAENRVDRWIGLGILLVGLLAVAAIIHTILLYV